MLPFQDLLAGTGGSADPARASASDLRTLENGWGATIGGENGSLPNKNTIDEGAFMLIPFT